MTQVLNKWSVMVHRKLKPDQEDAELDGEEGEKKGKKVIFFLMGKRERRRGKRGFFLMGRRERRRGKS